MHQRNRGLPPVIRSLCQTYEKLPEPQYKRRVKRKGQPRMHVTPEKNLLISAQTDREGLAR